MSATDLLHQPAAQSVGWALLHFAWQGALIGAVTFLMLALLRRAAADVRYVVATIGLTLMATMPVVTGLQVWSASEAGVTTARQSAATPPSSESARLGSPQLRAPVVSTRRNTPAPGALNVEPWLPIFVACWFVGVLVLTLRLASGWIWVQRMKTHGTVACAPALAAAVARLARRLHITRHVRLLESSLVDVPTVIGWLKPVVLVPASALAGLTPMQIEAILAHELAHIRRHDYLVNLLQTLVETLLFYHPAVWWLSRRIRAEREHCCDDLAVSLCGDPYTYAKALADLEDLRGAGGHLVMAATGGSLLHRVRRVLGAPTHAGRAPGWLAGSAAVLVMFGIVAGAIGTGALRAQPAAVAVQKPAEPAVPVVAWTPRSDAESRAVIAAGRPAGEQQSALESMARAVEAAGEALEATSATLAGTADAIGQAGAKLAPVKAGKRSGNFSWSSNGEKLEIRFDGDFEFSDDDTDITRMSPGGELRIKDGGWLGGRTAEFTADASGHITRRYWVGMSEKPFDPEGRQWLAQALPRFIRQSGIGAASRVARILKAHGAQGVLREISLIDGSYGKRLYFTELLKSPIDAATAKLVLVQVGKELDSDYERATLLIESADKLLVDDGTRQAYFDAASRIGSDYEMRRVYTAALKRGPVSNALLVGILDASRNIDSDYEEASLLVQISGLQPLDAAANTAFFRALDGVSSDYERGRVLKALLRRQDASNDTVLAVIRAVKSMGSDYEQSQVLQAIASSRHLTEEARDAYIEVATGLGDYEQGRALAALVKSERRVSR